MTHPLRRPHRGTGLPLLVITIALAALNVHAAHGQSLTATLLRLVFSLGAIGVAFLARRQSFITSALVVASVELVGGTMAFVLVDVPLVDRHKAQIGNFAVAVYERYGLAPR